MTTFVFTPGVVADLAVVSVVVLFSVLDSFLQAEIKRMLPKTGIKTDFIDVILGYAMYLRNVTVSRGKY